MSTAPITHAPQSIKDAFFKDSKNVDIGRYSASNTRIKMLTPIRINNHIRRLCGFFLLVLSFTWFILALEITRLWKLDQLKARLTK